MDNAKRMLKNQKKLINQENRITSLRKQLVYYKEITETVREPFIILDTYLNVVTANTAFYRKFKVKKSDTEGKRIYDLGNKQWNSPELRILLENILPTHRVLNNYAVKHDFPNLGQRTILLNARQVDNKQLILLAMEDVTEQIQFKLDSAEMTINLISQRDKLQNLNEAKDEFISMASHQLRTPATVVKQYIEMVRTGYAGILTEDQMNMLGVAHRNNEYQLEIIENLLRVAKLDTGKVTLTKSPYDVRLGIEKAIEGQAILFESRGQTVIFNKPKTKMMANVDPKLLLMVFHNVLDNAGKYSDDGARITITIHQDKLETKITFEDNGVGIGKVDQKKLFKKFSRIDNPHSTTVKGTGLGLYWVKRVLDLHSGTIKVTSKRGVGSTFEITIPNDGASITA